MKTVVKAMQWLGVVAVLGCLMVACRFQSAAQKKAETFYQQGVEEARQKDYQAAVSAYDQALELDPDAAKIYNNRANAQFELGNQNQAIKDYNQALKLNPDFAEAYYNRGFARYKLGNAKGALQDYNRALELNPDYIEAYGNRAVVYSELGDRKAAIADYDKILEHHPNLAEVYYNRGGARYQLGDKEGAVEDLQVAANLFERQGKRTGYQQVHELLDQIQQ